jgi:hypothetical protein
MSKDLGGAPIGNQNGRRGTIARNALIKALKNKSGANIPCGMDEYEALVKIWDKQIDAATDGSVSAAKEIFDRLDGKAPQGIDLNATVATQTHEEWLSNLS